MQAKKMRKAFENLGFMAKSHLIFLRSEQKTKNKKEDTAGTFHNDGEGHSICIVITLILVKGSKA